MAIDIPVLKNKKLIVLDYGEKYKANKVTAAQIARYAGVKTQFVQSVLHHAGIKKAELGKYRRVEAFAKFYRVRMYTVQQIAKFTGYTDGSVREIFSRTGVRKLSIVDAVDEMMSDGVSFDYALKLTSKTMDSYARAIHNKKQRLKNEHKSEAI